VMEFTDAEGKLLATAQTTVEALRHEMGGDLLRLDSLNRPAQIETVNGYGFPTRYGVRSLFTFGDHFYAGFSGAANRVEGWRLMKLTPQSAAVRPPIRRAVGQRVMEVVVRAAQVGLGALPAQASPVSVKAGARVDFSVKLKNHGGLTATRSRVCLRLPKGFDFASTAGLAIKGREACKPVGSVKGRGTKTVVVHAIASAKAGTVVGVATGSGTELTGDPVCGGGSTSGLPVVVEARAGRRAQTAAAAAAADPCPDLNALTASERRANLNGFRVFAKPSPTRVRVRAATAGGVTG
jgi:hypothetical protein